MSLIFLVAFIAIVDCKIKGEEAFEPLRGWWKTFFNTQRCRWMKCRQQISDGKSWVWRNTLKCDVDTDTNRFEICTARFRSSLLIWNHAIDLLETTINLSGKLWEMTIKCEESLNRSLLNVEILSSFLHEVSVANRERVKSFPCDSLPGDWHKRLSTLPDLNGSKIMLGVPINGAYGQFRKKTEESFNTV